MREKQEANRAREATNPRARQDTGPSMEFIFELFAEMLGSEKAQPEELRQEETAHVSEAAADAAERPEVQPVNIFNVVNFH